VRRLIVLLTTVLVVFGGCASSGTPGSTATTSDLAAVTVSGAVGSKPVVKFPGVFSTATSARKVLTEGTGAVVELGQKVEVDYVGINGSDGKEFDASAYDPASPTVFTLAESALIKGFVDGLVGVKVGSRVLLAITPADGYGDQGQPAAGITGKDTLLFVIDVLGARTVLSRAEGTAVAPVPGNPVVTLGETGEPTITVPAGPPPSQLVIAPLITGAGPAVTASQVVTAHSVVAGWTSGTVIESSWAQGGTTEFDLAGGTLIPGVAAALVGQPVGSQVLAVVPQPDGITVPGATASAAPTAPDALIFVLDILDAS
jgi:peptidylprolyl isomerase